MHKISDTTNLRDLKVSQSFSNPGTPLDNAVAESFFACMKREESSHNLYETREQLEDDVAEYVDYYNRVRPHQRMGMRTPIEVEEDFLAGLEGTPSCRSDGAIQTERSGEK